MKRLVIAVVSLVFIGCADISRIQNTVYRSDGEDLPDKTKAIVVGQIPEGYFTQPHGLYVFIDSVDSPTRLFLNTLGNEDDSESKNRLGHKFMFELPAGEYQISRWSYRYFKGNSVPLNENITFNIEAGKAYYIGDFHGEAITFCLSNSDNFNDTITKTKAKYSVLAPYDFINLSEDIEFKEWGHDKSDVVFSSKAKCEQPIRN